MREGVMIAFHHVVHLHSRAIILRDGEADRVRTGVVGKARALPARITEVAAECVLRFSRRNRVGVALPRPSIAQRKECTAAPRFGRVEVRAGHFGGIVAQAWDRDSKSLRRWWN